MMSVRGTAGGDRRRSRARLGVPIAAAEDRARKFAWEIASDFSYPVVRAGELVLERLWRRLYDGVEVHHGRRDRQDRAGQGARLPAQPSQPHRLPAAVVPRQCAGARAAAHRRRRQPEFPARRARSCGAAARFFLRRSFKGEPLYAAVFRGVSARDARQGIPDRVFHRGRPQPQRPDARAEGRAPRHDRRELHARASAAAAARPGALQLREAARRAHAGRRARGAAEAGRVAGRAAERRRATCKRDYGRVYVNFGAPLSVDQFLDREAPDWHALQGDDAARRGATAHAAASGARWRSGSTPPSSSTRSTCSRMAIVPSPRHALDERALAQQIEWLEDHRVAAAVFAGRGARRRVNPASAIAQAVRARLRQRAFAHPLGDVIKVPDDAGRRRSTTFATTCCTPMRCRRWSRTCWSARREVTPERVAEFAAGGLPFLRAGAHAAPLARRRRSPKSRRIVELFVEMGLARAAPDGTVRAGDRYSPEHAGLELLARSLRHLLRRNYLTIALLTRFGAGRLQRKRLEELMQMLTQRLSLLFEFAPPGFLRALDVRVVHRHAARDGPHRGEDADGALRLQRAGAHMGEARRAAAAGGRRDRDTKGCRADSAGARAIQRGGRGRPRHDPKGHSSAALDPTAPASAR